MLRLVFGFLAFVVWSSLAWADEYTVPARPGAATDLFQSKRLKAGDTVVLGEGRHGILRIKERRYDPPVSILAEGAVFLDRLVVLESHGIIVKDLTVRPEGEQAANVPMVHVRNGRDIVLDGLSVSSTSSDATQWGAGHWRKFSRDGIRLAQGRDITVRNSHLRFVKHGIESKSQNVLVENNTIEWFSGDGIRGIGNDSAYLGNRIERCVDVDENHDDGFQSWSVGERGSGSGVVRNVRLENNTILNGEGPLVCRLQGIGMFDGIFEDWIIRGNTVIVNHWHGITVMGARRVTISNNLVVDAKPNRPGPPWIAITPHKDGRPPENSEISDNITQPTERNGSNTFGQRQKGVTYVRNMVAPTVKRALELAKQ